MGRLEHSGLWRKVRPDSPIVPSLPCVAIFIHKLRSYSPRKKVMTTKYLHWLHCDEESTALSLFELLVQRRDYSMCCRFCSHCHHNS